MSVKIRLSRKGSKKRPFYHIVVANSRAPRDGDFIEKVGTYNPMLPREDAKRVTLVGERIKHWLSIGAEPTDKVARFLSDAGLTEKKYVINDKQTKKPLPKAKAQERMKALEEKRKAEEEAKKQAEAEAQVQFEAGNETATEEASAAPASEETPAS